MSTIANNRFIQVLFFGNYFYGICVVALSIEATLQQKLPLNTPVFYFLCFLASVLFYTQAYVKTEATGNKTNQRAYWYFLHKNFVTLAQLLNLFLLGLGTVYLFNTFYPFCFELYLYEYVLIFIFPTMAIMYYGFGQSRFNLRNLGLIKPFIIGFIWAGITNIYPTLYYHFSHQQHFALSSVAVLLFLKNFIFISVLGIMFDIKDFAMDYNQQLKTFVVKVGLRRTIFYILIPLTLLALMALINFALQMQFQTGRIILNVIPFICLLVVAYSLQKRKGIFYYLVVIDGLMLLKSFCGITASLFF